MHHDPHLAAAPHARRFLDDLSGSAVAAGVLAVVIAYAGPLLIYLQAATVMGVSPAAFSSWVMAISAAAGVSGLWLSLRYRAPVLVAWSAPGCALLVTVGPGLPFAEVVGAYLLAALAILGIGVFGLFDRLVALVPRAVAAGMMAGILLGFGTSGMLGLESRPLAVATMLASFVILTRLAPGRAPILLLGLAILLSLPGAGSAPSAQLWAAPELVWPRFSGEAVLSLTVPLVITTLTGQFLAGLAILRTAGFEVPARPVLVSAGVLAIPSALFGGITTALASITMALGAGPEAHPDPSRRYVAGVAAGVLFLICAVFAGSVGGLVSWLPTELVAVLAALALTGAIAQGLRSMLEDTATVQAGMLTFLVSASGVSVLGAGAAFWGVVVGTLAVHLARLSARASVRWSRD